MHVDQLIARVRSRIATMQTTAEEYEIEARFHADKALDLRLGVMELNQLINSVREFVDGEPDETPADSRPGSEATASDAAAALAGEVFPSASPAPHSPDGASDAGRFNSGSLTEIEVKPQVQVLPGVGEADAKGGPTGMGRSDSGESLAAGEATVSPAPHSAETPTDETGTASSSDNSTAARMDGRQVIGSEEDGAAFDAGAMTSQAGTQAPPVEPIPTYSRAGHIGTWVRGDEKAPDPAPAGGAATSPAPNIRERVQALHEAHPEYTARKAREALDITKGSLSGHSSALGITWAPADFVGRPVSPSKMDRVRLVHEQHPTWTARMIASHLGEKEASVSTMLATIRKRAAAAVPPPPEFAGRAEMVGHYTDVAKRLGKV